MLTVCKNLKFFNFFKNSSATNLFNYVTKQTLLSSTVSVKNYSSELPEENENFSPVYITSVDGLNILDENLVAKNIIVCEDFVSNDEEQFLLKEVEPTLKRLRYESSHWDDAIHGYRETEKMHWSDEGAKIIDKIKNFAFPPGTSTIKLVHILDLADVGFIKPHVDSVRFCGNTVAGLSLLSNSVMRFVSSKDKSVKVDVLLPQRSLYVMRDKVRYEFTHEILQNDSSYFNGMKIDKGRRISVICRNEPPQTDV